MTTEPGQSFLEIWLRTLKEKIPEGGAILNRSFSTVALFYLRRTAFYSMLGPFGVVADDIVKSGVETLYTAGREWWRSNRPFSTLFEVENTGRGLIVVRNKDPANLRSFPLRLAGYAEIPVARLATPVQAQEQPLYDGLSAARSVDSSRLVRQLWRTDRSLHVQCPHCREKILRLTSMELGHAANCPFNAYSRAAQTAPVAAPSARQRLLSRKCLVCGQYLKVAGTLVVGHARNCMLNPNLLGLSVAAPAWRQAIRQPETRRRLAFATPGLVVDSGALNAVCQGADLYPVGVIRTQGEFAAGARVTIYDPSGRKVAEGTAQYSSSEIDRIRGKQSGQIRHTLGFSRGDGVILGRTVRVL